MSNAQISIKLPLPGGKELDQCHPNEISAAMNTELDSFNKYMEESAGGGLVPIERTLLKTYLAWKLLYELKI